ncbi:MAG: putative Histidine kinase [Promethearchaeota archaeon]|nr:MAG: putative Histidine kinase [Candidatus Lokiarchaeota archaeon]
MSHKIKFFQKQKLNLKGFKPKEIFTLFPFAILITDISKGENIYVNPKFTEIFGYEISEIHSRERWLKKAYPNKDYRKYVDKIWEDDLKKAETQENDPRILDVRTNSGDIVKTRFRLINIKNKKAIILAEDISEKRKLEYKLSKSEQKYQHLFESSPFSIILLNYKGDIIDCNSAAERLLGYTKEEFRRDKIKLISLIPREYHQQVNERIKMVQKSKNLPKTDIMMNKKNGKSIWVNAKSSLVKVQDTYYFQIIFNDITYRKKMEDILKKSEAKYRNAYDYTQFLRDLFTHDVNNIFQSLFSIADLLNLYIKNDLKEELSTIPEKVENQIKRGQDLISNVEILSEVENTPTLIIPIDSGEIVRKAVHTIKRRYPEKSLEINLESKKEGLKVRGHKFLQKCFENVIVNSIHHNYNSPIKIQIIISEEIQDQGVFVIFTFIDNGIGISDEQKKNILDYEDLFEIQKKRMGLGLLLVKKIIREISGIMYIEDKVKGDPSQGTIFKILIPKAS